MTMHIIKYAKDFMLAVLAGIAISLGCIVFLSISNKVAGSVLFATGLLTILNFNLNLFTGKAPYMCNNKLSYSIFVLIVWLGNFAGAWVTSNAVRLTSVHSKIIDQCTALAVSKSADSLSSLFNLGIFCGMLMFIAVDVFNKNKHTNSISAVILTIFCVSAFILAGFEHSIADMFYFMLVLSFKDYIVPLLVISIGNIIGGNIFCYSYNVLRDL